MLHLRLAVAVFIALASFLAVGPFVGPDFALGVHLASSVGARAIGRCMVLVDEPRDSNIP